MTTHVEIALDLRDVPTRVVDDGSVIRGAQGIPFDVIFAHPGKQHLPEVF